MSLNRVQIIGFLGSDPETRQTQSGHTVTNFSVATNKVFTDKEGAKKESTQWHRVVAFSRLAETCGKYLTKGSRVYLEGEINYRSYEKDGDTKYVTEIVAERVTFLDAKAEATKEPSNISEKYGVKNHAPKVEAADEISF